MAYGFAAASTQYLSVADTAALDITGALTVSCRLKMSLISDTENRGVVSKWFGFDGATQRSYNLATTQLPKKINGVISSTGSFQAGNNAVGGTAISDGVWQHAALVFVPSTSVTVFLDGSQDGQVTSSIPASLHSGTADLWIGQQFFVSSTSAWNGDISEVAIYDTNLNSSEITALSKGFKPSRVRPQNLVFYAPLIRNLIDRRRALAITNNNSATVAAHPRVI